MDEKGAWRRRKAREDTQGVLVIVVQTGKEVTLYGKISGKRRIEYFRTTFHFSDDRVWKLGKYTIAREST